MVSGVKRANANYMFLAFADPASQTIVECPGLLDAQ
jgi:hypothetical protein